ncbi:Rib/alpha-like domain-containing protein, partial [Eremococcus coleocola]|uniref:Rib/alpha-like domain-containing protein n=1 Tax=Eremococcus coleocola TaxID=88132 RepID=UPI0004817A25
MGPNVEVTYDIYKVNDKGEEVLIKEGHTDKVPLLVTKEGEATKYDPSYTAVDGKVGEEATVAAPTFTDKEGNPATPENVTYELGEGAPADAVVNADGSVTYTPVDGDAGKAVNIPVVVKYSDGTTDNATATINVAAKDTTAPVITADNVTAVEGKEITPVPVTTDDEKAKVTVENLPEGLKYNPETKQIEGTVPKAEDWGDKEEKTVTATVKAVDEAGNKSTKEITVTIQRDKDGDGTPDVTDKDDDGDGIPDEDDENPKVADELTLTVTPETQTKIEGKDGTEIDPIKAESNKPGATITTDNPNLIVGEDGTITGTLPKIEDWGDTEEERTIEVKVTSTVEGEDPVEKTVTITVQRDTDGDGDPDVTDKDDDGDGIPDEDDENPKLADELTLTVTPETQTKIEGKDGTEIDPIKAESNKPGATITTDNPNLTVGEDGQITGTLPKIEDWGDDEEERTIEVKVTSTVEGEDPVEKTVTIKVQRDTDGDGTPDVTDEDDDNDGVSDEDEKEAGTDPKDPDSKPETPVEKDADKYDPTVEKEEIEKGGKVDLTDNVTN